jgi:hypothetical protein
VTHGVHAAVDAMQLPVRRPSGNRPPANSCLFQLPRTDNAVLTSGKARYFMAGRGEFGTHTVRNSP